MIKDYEVLILGPGPDDTDRLRGLMTEMDADYIPSISSVADIGEYAKKLVENACVLILKVKQQDVGLCAVYLNRTETQEAFISSIGVKKSFWGRGYAAVLLNEAFTLAIEKNFDRILLEVYFDNHRAIQFYKKYRFYIKANKESSYIMEKKLNIMEI